ncbi:unannotated protein [freshwater metagenome]|uniref:Unannotated protein n=1 Tax=freshwater metagenome TaxID=449393 RepID=A0A6J6PCP3_9ZZZZ
MRSWHAPGFARDGLSVDLHHVRLVYDGTVDADAPAPHVVEVDGTTAAAAWLPLADVVAGRVPLATLARQELADYAVARVQRVSAKALVRRGDDVLLARISPRGAHPGTWTLPGGGIEHGEPPAAAVAREVREECGLSCEVGAVLAVTDAHFSGTAPSGRDEDFHAVQVVYAVTVAPDAEPGVVELGGTTDAVAWVPVADVLSGSLPVEPVVLTALTT